MEVKKPKRNPELIQKVELDEIRGSGGCAVVVRSLKEAKQVVSFVQRIACGPRRSAQLTHLTLPLPDYCQSTRAT